MQLFILAVGKGRVSPENTLTQGWLSRLPKGGSLIEVESKFSPGQKRTDDESSRLLRAMPDDAALAVLDPRGKDHSSEDLAALIGTWRDDGFAAACFAIGGADGHADALRQKAERSISFGRATWPHMLFRAMLAEQLYRASSILAGHPYQPVRHSAVASLFILFTGATRFIAAPQFNCTSINAEIIRSLWSLITPRTAQLSYASWMAGVIVPSQNITLLRLRKRQCLTR